MVIALKRSADLERGSSSGRVAWEVAGGRAGRTRPDFQAEIVTVRRDSSPPTRSSDRSAPEAASTRQSDSYESQGQQDEVPGLGTGGSRSEVTFTTKPPLEMSLGSGANAPFARLKRLTLAPGSDRTCSFPVSSVLGICPRMARCIRPANNAASNLILGELFAKNNARAQIRK